MTDEILTDLDVEDQAEEKVRTKNRKDRGMRSGYIIGIIFFSLSILSDIANFVEFGAWQILAESAGDLASLVLLLISFRRFNHGEIVKAQRLFPYIVLATYTSGELFISGSLINNIFSGLLLLWIIYYIFDVEEGRRWVQFSIIHVLAVLLFSAFTFLPKFYLDLGTTNAVITTGFSALLGWQFIRRFEIRSIQVRLLLIMLGVAMGPLLISSITSTLIDLQRDTTRVETLLQLVSNTTSSQITDTINTITSELETIDQNPTVLSNTQILIQFTPTEATRQQIEDSIKSVFRQRITNSDYLRHISLLDISGEVLISTNVAMVGRNLQTDDGFTSALVNRVEVDPYIDQFGFTQARLYFPMIGDDGITLAVIMAEINFRLLFPILADSTQFLGETGEAYLINNEGQLISPLRGITDVDLGTQMTFPDVDDPESQLSGDILLLTYTNLAGEDIIGTSTNVAGVNGRLILEQNREEAYSALQLSAVINIVIAIITLIIAISLAVVISQNFTAPIENISEAARKVLQGESIEFPNVDRADEIGTLTNTLSEMTTTLLATTVNLEETVNERTAVLERRASYLETTSLISRATTGIYDLTSLLNTVSQLISENFGFYHVGIFINDDRDEFSVLRASNSEGGWKMLARGHQLKVGAQGIVGYVTGSGEARVQQQVVGDDSVYFDNPDLPLTRSEMALPLRAGEEIFGALDVQSTEEQAFSDEDVAVLQTLADTVSVTIQNARLVEELRENLETERRLFGEITKQTWTNMLSREQKGFSVRSDSRGTQLVTTPSTDVGKLAMKEQMPIIGNLDEENHAYPAALPVTVRGGAIIGVIETMKPEAEGPWTQEEISILENVSSELGLALDNARLFEETQRRAQRDRIATELSSKIWASPDMDNILQTAVKELGSALNVSRGQIRLSMADSDRFDEADSDKVAEATQNIPDGANQP